MIMFCSKCGKEIADDAAFCSGCGFGVNGTAQTSIQVRIPAISEEEKNRKFRAMIVFFISAMIEVSVVLGMLLTKMQCLKLIIGDTSHAERYLEKMWDEHGSLIMMFNFLIIICEIILSIVFYIVPYIKRQFSSVKKHLISTVITDAVVVLAAGGWLAYYVNSEGFDNFMVILVVVLLLFSKIFVAISYNIAANVEDGEKYIATKQSVASKLSNLSSGNVINSSNGLWRCGKCGTENNNVDSFCKDCGNYK